MTEVESKEMEEKVLAVDAVILLSAEISNLAITLSRKLKDSPFVLNNSNYLPHITLVQGYINDLEQAGKAIEQVASQLHPFKVVIDKFETAQAAPIEWGGYYFSYLVVEKNQEILKLHQELLDALPTVTWENPKEVGAFISESGEQIVEGALDYVGQFKLKNSGKNYWPHITLGGSKTPQILSAKLPVGFEASEIVLCQLGNFCTCRKILGR